MAFTWYGEGGKGVKEIISISKNGILTINTAAHRQCFQGCKNVLLGYDPDRRIIGIKPVEETTEHSWLAYSSTLGLMISAQGFLEEFGIRVGHGIICSIDWNTFEKLAEIDMEEAIVCR